MKTKFILLLCVTFFALQSLQSQTSVNDYKYVIVPNIFDFQKEEDQYRLNTLTKVLFEKYGYTVIMENEALPDDALSNVCLALRADVIRESGAFNSKLKVQLENCKKIVVFTSNIGKSKEKKYQVAYTLALREAFKSFELIPYAYKENEVVLAYGNGNRKNNDDEIEKLKKEIKTLKEEKKAVAELPKEEKPVVVKEEVSKAPKKPKTPKTPKVEVNESLNVLYAQKTTNGFQLVDSTPKVVYQIKKTGMQHVYLVEGKNAIIYKLDANWVLEYYENDILKTKIIHIKF